MYLDIYCLCRPIHAEGPIIQNKENRLVARAVQLVLGIIKFMLIDMLTQFAMSLTYYILSVKFISI